MTDMTSTIIAKSDQLNSDDLIGRSLTIRVSKVSLLAGEQPISIHYEGDDGKPWKPCKSMRRVLVGVWGSDGNAYVGRSLTLYRDNSVTFGGQEVGGIRISHMSHLEKSITMSLTATKKSKKPFTVRPLAVSEQRPAAEASVDHDLENLKLRARDHALGGCQAFDAWILTLTVNEKIKLKPFGAEFRKLADESDAGSGSQHAGGVA